MKRRHLILLLGGASSGAMSIGTGAFSSVEAKRGVAVNVVEDENAYLGLQQNRTVVPVDKDASPGEEGNGRNGFLTVTNQFTAPLALGVTLNGAEGDFEGIEIDVEDPIEKGEDLRDGSRTETAGWIPATRRRSALISVISISIRIILAPLRSHSAFTVTQAGRRWNRLGGLRSHRYVSILKRTTEWGAKATTAEAEQFTSTGSLVTFRCTSTVTQKVSPSLPPMDRTFSNRAGPVAELPG